RAVARAHPETRGASGAERRKRLVDFAIAVVVDLVAQLGAGCAGRHRALDARAVHGAPDAAEPLACADTRAAQRAEPGEALVDDAVAIVGGVVAGLGDRRLALADEALCTGARARARARADTRDRVGACLATTDAIVDQKVAIVVLAVARLECRRRGGARRPA